MKKRADLQSNWIKLIGLGYQTSEPPRAHVYRKIEGKILVSGKYEYSPSVLTWPLNPITKKRTTIHRNQYLLLDHQPRSEPWTRYYDSFFSCYARFPYPLICRGLLRKLNATIILFNENKAILDLGSPYSAILVNCPFSEDYKMTNKNEY